MPGRKVVSLHGVYLTCEFGPIRRLFSGFADSNRLLQSLRRRARLPTDFGVSIFATLGVLLRTFPA